MKLDAELVRGIDHTPRKRTVVTAVVQMCLGLGAQVIAKDVNTELEARTLLDCSVAYAQGPLMGTPTAMPSVSMWRGPR